MFEEILACLDGSSLAEKILPLARRMAAPKGSLTVLRVVADQAELAAEEAYLRDCAHQYGAKLRFVIASDPARAICLELDRNPHAIAALTTHGRTAWMEAILGSVALRVVGESKRPIVLFRPLEYDHEAPGKISQVAVALDGSELSEKMILCGVRAAQSLSARLLLLQALPSQAFQDASAQHITRDVLESSYLHGKAADIKAAYHLDADWEILHGEPADAICQYLKGMPDTLLAMTTHARTGVERFMLGSVAGYCVRHAAVPLLLHSPRALPRSQ